MFIRKKSLKIQERLGMRIGIAYGISATPVVKTADDALKTIEELYKIGFKAFLLPQEFLSNIKTSTDLYKEHYTSLLNIKTLASKHNIELSIHVSSLPDEPYLSDRLKLYTSIANVMDSRLFILHPTFYKMMPHEQSLKLVIYKINEIVNEANVKSNIGIETTGRINEVGSLEDVIDVVTRTKKTEPVLNWGHIHARGSGALRTVEDFVKVIKKLKSEIGTSWMNNAYFIFSGMTYGPSGAISHTGIDSSDPSLEHLIRAVMSYNIKGTLIFETINREKDVLSILEKIGDMVR